jgi:hypothetical protein
MGVVVLEGSGMGERGSAGDGKDGGGALPSSNAERSEHAIEEGVLRHHNRGFHPGFTIHQFLPSVW